MRKWRNNMRCKIIVYYASREGRTWTVHSSCQTRDVVWPIFLPWCVLVYYAPRERKGWLVHSTCKLTSEPKARVANTCYGLVIFLLVVRKITLYSTKSSD